MSSQADQHQSGARTPPSSHEVSSPIISKLSDDQVLQTSVALSHPLYYVLANHELASEASWSVDRIREIVKKNPASKHVIWLESIHPSRMPGNPFMLISAAASGQLGIEARQIDWLTEFQKGLSPSAQAVLAAWYHEEIELEVQSMESYLQAVAHSQSSDQVSPHDFPEWDLELRNGLLKLAGEGYGLAIDVERSPFESYVKTLQGIIYQVAASHWFTQGQSENAAFCAASCMATHEEASTIRDIALVDTVVRRANHFPHEIQIITRGINHHSFVSGLCESRNLKSEFMVEAELVRDPLECPRGLTMELLRGFKGVPSDFVGPVARGLLRTVVGDTFARQQIMLSTLDILFRACNAVPENLLREWLVGVGSAQQSSPIKAVEATLTWLTTKLDHPDLLYLAKLAKE